MTSRKLEAIAAEVAERGGRIVALTGAGISAESGIPTFRGADGYWTVGSVNYHPEQLATRRYFEQEPSVVWPWYLYRITTCRDAQPNSGHRALVAMEEKLGGRFRLVTQNVDGLHVRAGSDPDRTYHIHGNLDHVRCANACTPLTRPLPAGLRRFAPGDTLSDEDRALLHCDRCGGWLRPHVLWFDEHYDEAWYRFHSTVAATSECDLLLVVGTAGATNLPMQMGGIAASNGAIVIDVNLSRSPFTEISEATGGAFIQGAAGEVLPNLIERLVDAVSNVPAPR